MTLSFRTGAYLCATGRRSRSQLWLTAGARTFIADHDLPGKAGHILLSPAFNKSPSPLRTTDNATLDPRTLVEWMMADGIPARLSLQIHKFIWEPMKKGV